MNFNLSKIANKVSNTLHMGSIQLTAQRYSPELLMGVGVVGFIGTVVLASRATIKAKEVVIPEHQETMNRIQEVWKAQPEEYTEHDYNKDRVAVITQTTFKISKTYAPTLIVGASSIACFFGAYRILRVRNAALAAAYSLIHTAFEEYRGRVKEELGIAYDTHFRYGSSMKEITVDEIDENGKKKKVKKLVIDNSSMIPDVSMYARLYEPYEFDPDTGLHAGTHAFTMNHEMNYLYLQNAESVMNDRLRIDSYVFLNDVYEYLGLTRTKAGQVVGWLYKGEKDEGISFMDSVDLHSYSDGDPILLDFNVQGAILNDIN